MSGLLVSPPPPHFIQTNSTVAGHCCEEENHQQQQQHYPHRSLRFANMVTASAGMSGVGGDCKTVTADDSSTPADSLDDVAIIVAGGTGSRTTPENNRLPQNLQQLREKLYARDDDGEEDEMNCCDGDVVRLEVDGGYSTAIGPDATKTAADDDDSSDDGCDRRDDCDGAGGGGDDNEDEDEDEEGEYATLSARSVCSATTAANDDFEYFAAADRSAVNDEDGSSDTGPITQPTVLVTVVNPFPGCVPYQRAPTRRARHHQHQLQQPHYQPHHPQHHHQQLQHHHHHNRQARVAPAFPPTPPTPRRPKARLMPVLSVDSLVAAQAAADAAAAGYPRTTFMQHHHAQQQHQQQHHHLHHGGGGRYRGGASGLGGGGIAGRRLGGGRGRDHHGGSVPDLKRVFITDFL